MLQHELQESQYEMQAAKDKAIKLEKEVGNSLKNKSNKREQEENRQDAQ